MTKKSPTLGALTRINLPQKSHLKKKPAPSTVRSVVKDLPPVLTIKWYYNSFSELCNGVHALKSNRERNLKEIGRAHV